MDGVLSYAFVAFQKKFDQAEKISDRCVAMCKKTLEPDHPARIYSLKRKAALLAEQAIIWLRVVHDIFVL